MSQSGAFPIDNCTIAVQSPVHIAANTSYDEQHQYMHTPVWCSPSHCSTRSAAAVTAQVVQSPDFTDFIRDDYLAFLEENLTYWKESRLWPKSALATPHRGRSSYESLESIYSCMCQLDMRMMHDPIRKRAASVLLDAKYKQALDEWQSQKKSENHKASIGVGRGDASAMIDNILQNRHSDWDTYDSRQRSDLRAKFHDEKRYGRRWAIFVAALGPSILFLCSAQLARTVYVLFRFLVFCGIPLTTELGETQL